MRSQKLNEHFGTPICIDSTDSEKEDVLCYHHPSFNFNRDTYQMSPLLFESDTEDTSQSIEIKCYQEKTITPQLSKSSNQQMFDILSTLNNLRNEISSQLDTSTQHNQCCSETLLNSTRPRTLNETKSNTYVSPSPRVTRSKVLNSRILTRSAKRLHNIKDFSNSPRNSRKPRKRKDLKGSKSSTNGKDSNVNEKASDTDTNDTMLIESIRQSNNNMIVERPQYTLFQNPNRIEEKFIQPNIVPNIETLEDADNDLDFLNRRLSSEVQILTEEPGVITISSESPSYTLRVSPDMFENCESSSVSNLCSQNSFDIPNGQVLLQSRERSIGDDTSSSPNNQHNSTLVPFTPHSFNQQLLSPDVNAARQQLIDKSGNKLVENAFEITANEIFDNVIYITDSEETLTSQRANDLDCDNKNIPPEEDNPRNIDKSDNLIDVTKRASQESTPRKRPEIPNLLNKSQRGNQTASTTLNRSKWLSKPKSTNSDAEFLNRTSHRCRRLDLWFQDRGSKSMIEGNERKNISNVLLSSSEDEDS